MLSQSSSDDNTEYPILVLTQQPDSHHFNERRIVLNDTIKVGRSVARARPCESNAIFDCKVLSRNHAIFWCDNGKVWLKDTKSSNGTFVNSQLLSKGTEDSAPREIYSGDIIQFGVEVVENTTTHGCIIAQTTVFLSDGNELRRHSDAGGVPSGNVPISNYYEEQIYQLAQYIQEASHREQTLEKKLNSLSQLIVDTQEASDCSWKVILNQDRLMEKLELLQEQVDMHAKGDDGDSLAGELQRVLEQRYGLERESKGLLEGLMGEKTDVLQRVVDLEQSLGASEEECAQLRLVLESLQSEHGQISERLSSGKDEVESLQRRLKDAQTDYENEINRHNIEKQMVSNRYDQLNLEYEDLRAKLDSAETEIARGHIEEQARDEDVKMMRENLVTTEVEMYKYRDMLSRATDRQSPLDSSVIGIQNQLTRALVTEILALQNLSQLKDSVIDSEMSLDSFIVGTTSELGLHFIESHQQIRNGIELIALMKEELLRLQKMVLYEKTLSPDGGLEGSLCELDNLLDKLDESQCRSKTLLAQIPERLLLHATKSDEEIGAVMNQVEATSTGPVALYSADGDDGGDSREGGDLGPDTSHVSVCHSSVQTERVGFVDSCIQYETKTEVFGVQVDTLVSPEEAESYKRCLENLQCERKITESLKVDLLQLQDEKRQLEKSSLNLSKIVDELRLESSSTRQDAEIRRDSVQRIASEGYSHLFHESQELRKRVQEIEEEMAQKRQEYDTLYEQYEALIGAQNGMRDCDTGSKKEELEALCLRQRSEMEELRHSMSHSYEAIVARSRKISALSVVPLSVLLVGIIVTIISFLGRPWLLPA